ncbi:hypothetical protein HanHA300_Chr15g0558111 [Helianthus annuus]|nr:hypothetical protein HanHA300_Chr15g0558111 [Helianthus annuus]KAJ0472453.1 hypothetical protein HanHA89_Chr15g0607221 [Helianthus annuus]KAJ0648054.1 hypothetical protein HanLR1_Chr15g0568581 [Helianthus annuus]
MSGSNDRKYFKRSLSLSLASSICIFSCFLACSSWKEKVSNNLNYICFKVYDENDADCRLINIQAKRNLGLTIRNAIHDISFQKPKLEACASCT